jgi:hypothetical protein
VGDLSKFQIRSLNFLDGQVLKLWDVKNYTTATATYSPSTTWVHFLNHIYHLYQFQVRFMCLFLYLNSSSWLLVDMYIKFKYMHRLSSGRVVVLAVIVLVIEHKLDIASILAHAGGRRERLRRGRAVVPDGRRRRSRRRRR